MDTEQAQDTFLSHLIELRNRLLWSLIAVGIVFVCLVPWAKDIYHVISQPMLAQLPKGGRMIATEITSPFFIPFKVTFLTAVLITLPFLLSNTVKPNLLIFVVFYGLDWIATVPPTVALCREHFGPQGTIVFGWVFASHQIGAAIAATAAGLARDAFGDYTGTWLVTGALVGLGLLVFRYPRRR